LNRKLLLFTILVLLLILVVFDEREVRLEPVTVDGFVVATTVEQSIQQGHLNFNDDELTELLPQLDRDIRAQNFTFYLELVDVQLDEGVANARMPLQEADLVVIDTEGTAIFDEITFYNAGIYTFRVHQSPDATTNGFLFGNVEADASATYSWKVDGSDYYFVVTVVEDEENSTLYASIEQDNVIFVNEFSVDVEEVLASIHWVKTYDDVDFRMSSEYALLINLTNGLVLFEHRADERTYPASVTKVMTALVGLENGSMDEEIVVEADFEGLYLSEAAQSGFSQGEIRTFSEIMHGIMLPSGGEATEALANHVAGSYEAFVDLMNEKAYELGMYDTHFVTATGLHDDDHYTTAWDIANLLIYALEIPEFRDLFTKDFYVMDEPNMFGDVMHSTLFYFAPTLEFDGGEIIGGRTGFTIPAGRCLASLATNGEDEFLLVTFGAGFDNDDLNAHIHDALLIFSYFLSDIE